ncbi:MAG: divalent-cation tolerance protein CutA [Planctomycetes bacterium]|nr:divalent-cation tolerance protein CutA [Planctomycetota bacterium]
MTDDVVLVLTAAPRDAAEALARAMVEARLAACVNLVPGVVSLFHWEGRIDRADEVLLVAKTVRSRADELRAGIAARHPYAVPEILVVPVEGGDERYLAWVRSVTVGGT